jgi:DNA-binding NarL/FixJ family response regulator
MPMTILIADDSKSMRTIVRRSLLSVGFSICGEATDGVEAISKATSLAPDLIILDVRMPRLNGIEAAAILKHTMPQIRIALLTLYPEAVSKTLTSATRVDAVLSKTDGIAKLVENIQTLLMTDPA